MEGLDKEGLEMLLRTNEEFKKAYEAHKGYNSDLQRFEKKGFLSADDEIEKNKLKKLKLAMKDKMQSIVSGQKQHEKRQD
ncbi:MAG: DUF465 domain-containing protein [Deltaproteobacteria bacterium]|nr:DUF465 domain-containing protein [Deltaproteobacteria bacterium]